MRYNITLPHMMLYTLICSIYICRSIIYNMKNVICNETDQDSKTFARNLVVDNPLDVVFNKQIYFISNILWLSVKVTVHLMIK